MKVKKIISAFLCICILITVFINSVSATRQTAPISYVPVENTAMSFDCRSAILIEASTGTVLFEQNADEPLPPASVTKIMTLLLVMEAIEAGKISLEDTVTASAHACSMGGSQIYLKEGEQMSVEDMIKSVVIASANDAAVALAEHIAGSEENFVNMMNKRAGELGMTNTSFENTNGLDDTAQEHYCSARDIAIMSAELISHKKITEYSSIWMDTIRNGEFGLTNTNRLVRFYKGATGLKTGSTSKAKFCVSASAERDGMSLICVIMAAPTRDVRNAAAASLLDWGFANFGVYNAPDIDINSIKVSGGVKDNCDLYCAGLRKVLNKSDIASVKYTVEIPELIAAPVNANQKIGSVSYYIGDKLIGTSDILSSESIVKIKFFDVFGRIFSKMTIM